MSSLLMFEPHSYGHHMHHVRRIAKEGISRGHEVGLVTFASSLEHPVYRAMQDECAGCVRTSILPHDEASFSRLERSSDPIKRRFIHHGMFADHYKKLPRVERPDVVFMPYLQSCLDSAAILGSPFGETPWGGLFVDGPSFHLGKMGIAGPNQGSPFLREQMFLRLLRNRTLRAAFTSDESLEEYVRRTKPSLAKKLTHVPDPAELAGTITRDAAREALGIASDDVLLLVYGVLNARKGIDALLDATREPDFPAEVSILLAGRQESDVEALLASPQGKALREAGRLHERNAYLRDEDEYTVFRASDMVWLGYRRHYGVSGVLVQAGMMGLPVIACDEGLIGWLTRRKDVGVVVSVNSPRAVREAITELVREPKLRAWYGEKGRHVFARYTGENFARAILDKLGFPKR